MALTVYKEPVDQPFSRKRVIAFVTILSSSFLVPVMAFFIAMPLIVGGTEWYGILYTAFIFIQAIDLILQIAHLVALFLLPKREEEEEIVERLKKFNLVTLMIWCFKCTNLPGPPEGVCRLRHRLFLY